MIITINVLDKLSTTRSVIFRSFGVVVSTKQIWPPIICVFRRGTSNKSTDTNVERHDKFIYKMGTLHYTFLLNKMMGIMNMVCDFGIFTFLQVHTEFVVENKCFYGDK